MADKKVKTVLITSGDLPRTLELAFQTAAYLRTACDAQCMLCQT